ncbi:hypothetical protein [Streptomyces capillispiralis]|nr:hypothetical protein [Streptomyces capillispiralis]
MSGDRRANELWYRFNQATLYDQSAEIKEAYAEINNHFGGNLPVTLRETWFAQYREPDYPANFAAFMAPVRRALRILSRVQLDVFDTYYARQRDLVEAFSYFGQGTLFDPRERAGLRVHTMDAAEGEAPTAYHTWFLFMRAMMLHGIDAERWRGTAPVLAFAWAVQNTARPAMDEVNPPLPHRTVHRLARTWLPLTTRRLDRAFQSFPGPPGTTGR